MSIASRMLSNHLILWYFYFCFQSFPALGSFLMSQVFMSGSQSTGASASVFQMNIQDWFSLGVTGLISLLSEGLSGVFITTTWKHQFLGTQPLYGPTLISIHDYCKNHVAVQSLSHVWLFVTPWTAAYQAPLSFTVSWSLLKLMSIDGVMPSNHLVPFSSCLQSFPVSGSFLMSQLFTSGGQSIRASASVLLMNIQDWFPLGLTGLISLQPKGPSRRLFSNTTVWKHQFHNYTAHLYQSRPRPYFHTYFHFLKIPLVMSYQNCIQN